MTFSFGQSEFERIEIEVLRYERTPIGDYHDDNWLTVQVRVTVAGFRCITDASFISEELIKFLSQLRPLYESLSGTAEFDTIEHQLHLELKGDRKGHIELVGEVFDRPGGHNLLHFVLQFDQTQLAASIRELELVTIEFPVRRA